MPKPALVCVFLTLSCAGARCEDAAIRVSHVGVVAPDMVAVTIESGRVHCGTQEPYVEQADDDVRPDGQFGPVWLWRGGEPLGSLVGPKRDTLWRFDQFEGSSVDTEKLIATTGYRVTSSDDPHFHNGAEPLAVYRKSKPTNMARVGPWNWKFPVRHVLYLRLRHPLEPGRHYQIRFPDGVLPRVDYCHDPKTQRSEAVHVNQIGFRPDDPSKVGFLSCSRL